MAAPKERTVRVNGQPCRVWEMGQGEPLGYLPGFGGLPRWTPILDRLAETRRVIVPSLPGFPGGLGHAQLDSHLDWLIATHELLRLAGLEGADLMGVSLGGALAADVAACWPGFVRRLVLLGALGLSDPERPMFDVFTCSVKTLPPRLCARPAAFTALVQPPRGAEDMEWQIVQTRAAEAAARLLWPLGDTRLARRLHRIVNPTLILWGEADQVVAPFYAQRIAQGLSGASRIEVIPGAGHLADLDEPEKVARVVVDFLSRGAAGISVSKTPRAKPQRRKPPRRKVQSRKVQSRKQRPQPRRTTSKAGARVSQAKRPAGSRRRA